MFARFALLCVCLTLCPSVGLTQDPHPILSILCPGPHLFGKPQYCREWGQNQTTPNPSSPSNQTLSDHIPTVPPVIQDAAKTAKIIGSWLQAILGLSSSLITIYTFLACSLKCRGRTTKNALTLGYYSGTRNPGQDLEAPSLPMMLSRRPASTV